MPGDEDLTDGEKRMQDRQAGNYSPPILAEPKGGPIPEYRPFPGSPDDEPEDDTPGR